MSRRLTIVVATVIAVHPTISSADTPPEAPVPGSSSATPPDDGAPPSPPAAEQPPATLSRDYVHNDLTSPPERDLAREEDIGEAGDQAIGAQLGLAAGGRVTVGGLRVAGHYLYQLSSTDWFDGSAAFTFGGGAAACFRDRSDAYICSHGFIDGRSVEVSASVRHLFTQRGDLRPFAAYGAGIALSQFSDDDVSGISLAVHAGGGLRAKVAPSVAVVVQGELEFGFGGFSHGLGAEPLFGVAVTAGAEFRLR